MSTVIAELYDALREAGASDDKARAAAGAVIGADVEDGLARKSDISLLRSDFETQLNSVRTDLQLQLNSVRRDLELQRNSLRADLELQRNSLSADIEAFRLANKADLSDLRAELIKWNVGTIIATAALFAAIVKLL